ncbi:MAG: hypothetical protein U1A25_00375 [Candidatus Sungbacteria bacterium]|nr:hypothetical protein [Candidatus Sungbacteria bacterium]
MISIIAVAVISIVVSAPLRQPIEHNQTADRNQTEIATPAAHNPPAWMLNRAREAHDNMIFFKNEATGLCFVITPHFGKDISCEMVKNNLTTFDKR